MTLDQYFSTPETVLPQELIFGAMRVAESPTTHHQETVGAMFLSLHEHVRRARLGSVWLAPLDVVLDAEKALVVQPDLFVILNGGGAATVLEKVYGPPDLVVEVMSPRPRIGETAERVSWFGTYGVRECWLIHHLERRVEVLQCAGGAVAARREYGSDEPLHSAVLPAFNATLTDIIGY